VAKLFHVDALLADKLVYSGKVSALVVPAQLGYLGVLADHAPLAAKLVPGKIIFRESSGKQNIIHSKGKGLIEVFKNNVTLLLDTLG